MSNEGRILIIGQCTLHWGRMEFGNIGNYYIVEPLFEELRRVFPTEEIATTMQFSERFCSRYSIETLPQEMYFDFHSSHNLEKAKKEYESVINGTTVQSSFIDEVRKASLVIDFSGDIWGDNANFLGKDRFATGCYKDLIAQHLCPTIMIAGSPGPFGSEEDLALAKKVYKGFDLVINREPISTELLRNLEFDLSKTLNYPCPSFAFKKADKERVKDYLSEDVINKNKINIGFIICGWNFERGPFDSWPRADKEYTNFVELIQYMINEKNAHIFLMSHSNGFKVPPAEFELIHGRDYPIVQQLYNIMCDKGFGENVTLLDGIYPPAITKGIIGQFDMLVSGRMHGAVAGISQSVPTVIIDYGHEPKAHKLAGFAELIGMPDCIVNPNDLDEMKKAVSNYIDKIDEKRAYLNKAMQDIAMQIKEEFDILKDFVRN